VRSLFSYGEKRSRFIKFEKCDRVLVIERGRAIAYNKFSDQNKRRQMPAKDLYHEAVKNALIKDGWVVS
jgi:ABC-type multidrug transport system ATPase subunit